MKVIAGLGNPGLEYEETRHNIGFKVVDFLAKRHGIQVKYKKFDCQLGHGKIKGVEVWLVKPQTFMNLSGKPLKAIKKEMGLNTDDFIVACDDIDLPLGKIQKKCKGGDAGHRGVRSILELFGSDAFYRVRMGVGRPTNGMETSDYVLSPFSRSERELALEMVECAADMAEELLLAGCGCL